jgi:hypothetical protein
VEPLVRLASVPSRIVQACRTAVARAARPYGVRWVDAVGAGRTSHTQDGGHMTAIEVRSVHTRGIRGKFASLAFRASSIIRRSGGSPLIEVSP